MVPLPFSRTNRCTTSLSFTHTHTTTHKHTHENPPMTSKRYHHYITKTMTKAQDLSHSYSGQVEDFMAAVPFWRTGKSTYGPSFKGDQNSRSKDIITSFFYYINVFIGDNFIALNDFYHFSKRTLETHPPTQAVRRTAECTVFEPVHVCIHTHDCMHTLSHRVTHSRKPVQCVKAISSAAFLSGRSILFSLCSPLHIEGLTGQR